MKLHVEVITQHLIATDSPDHTTPWGTARDNSRNPRFNQKIYQLFDYLERPPKILDLGCSGGGFVQSCLNDGCLSVGIEGSDYSKHHLRAAWPFLADRFLFTADISRKFQVTLNQQPLLFDVITLWEVMEHLPTGRLELVCENIHRHLEEHGLAIMSIASTEEIIRGTQLHLTVQKREKWIEMFRQHNLHNVEEYSRFFNTQYIRGPKQNAPDSFHLYLSRNPSKAPPIKKLTRKEWLIDRWLMSKPQRWLNKLIAH